MAERTTPGTKVALTVGATDGSGATGVLADVKTFSMMRVHATAAITAIQTANTRGTHASQVLPAALVREQIEAVANDFQIKATKVAGPIEADIATEIARTIQRKNLFPLVLDPAFTDAHHQVVVENDAIKAFCSACMPLAALVTANTMEAACLLDRTDPIADPYGARTAAAEICKRHGVAACLITGFRRDNDREGEAVDVLVNEAGEHELVSDWRPTDNTLGAGGVFSAAVTAGLALGQPMEEALQSAKQVVSESIRQTTDLGQGSCPVNVLAIADLD